MAKFGAASHGDILALLIQLAILLAVARLLGELCLRWGQPAVLGELGAGILLGPSLLGSWFPGLEGFVLPANATQGHLLEMVSMMGAMFLLLITGMEMDLGLIRTRWRTALGVWAGGVSVPLACGFALGMVLPDSLLGDPKERVVFALFMATAMSISAISVIAKVLRDLGFLRRDVGQIVLASGMTEDLTGWILLSVVMALASRDDLSAGPVALAVAKVLFFIFVSFTAGRVFVRRVLRTTQDNIRSRDRLITVVMVMTLAFAAFAVALGLEPVLGAFICGILLSTMLRLPKEVGHFYESVALGMFAPIFFAVAGLKVNLQALFQPSVVLYIPAVLLVACGGKVVGTYLGARLIGHADHWTALSMGAALNARGSLEIIVATIGLKLGILSQESFSMIVLIAPVTSLLAPPALRYTLARARPTPDEQARLDREKQAEQNWVASVRRVLVPIRYRGSQEPPQRAFEAAVFGALSSHKSVSVTLLTVVRTDEQAQATEWLQTLARDYSAEEVVTRVVVGDDPVAAVLEECQKDYGLVMLGATETPNQESLFSPVIDDLVRLCPCPTMVMRKGRAEAVSEFRRILVPTNGAGSARRGADLAFALAQDGQRSVEFLHVLSANPALAPGSGERQVELAQAHHSLSELVKMGESLGVDCDGQIRTGESPGSSINALARKPSRVDLVVLGTDLRRGDRLFLGPSVEVVLKDCRASVIVVTD